MIKRKSPILESGLISRIPIVPRKRDECLIGLVCLAETLADLVGN